MDPRMRNMHPRLGPMKRPSQFGGFLVAKPPISPGKPGPAVGLTAAYFFALIVAKNPSFFGDVWRRGVEVRNGYGSDAPVVSKQKIDRQSQIRGGACPISSGNFRNCAPAGGQLTVRYSPQIRMPYLAILHDRGGDGPENEISLSPIRSNIEARPVWRSPGPDIAGAQANANLPCGVSDTLLRSYIGEECLVLRYRSALRVSQFTLSCKQQGRFQDGEYTAAPLGIPR